MPAVMEEVEPVSFGRFNISSRPLIFIRSKCTKALIQLNNLVKNLFKMYISQIVPGPPSSPGVSSAGGRMAAHPCQLLELNWVWEERDSMGKKKKRGGRRKKREHDASAPQPVKLDASYYQEKEILND